MQTDSDWTQKIITDSGSHGYAWADKNIARHKHEVHGDYVYILDDDDYLIDPDFVLVAKQVAVKHDPDIIIVRARWKPFGGRVLPSRCWGKYPEMGDIGSPCFLVKKLLWREHIEQWGQPACGDFYFIKSLFDADCSVFWLNRVVAEVDQIGHIKDRRWTQR